MIIANEIETARDFKAAEKLFCEAFPCEERISFGFLKMRAAYDDVEFTAYRSENIFVGISYVMKFKNLAFIFYLAVKKNYRSKGYGGEILKIIRERYADKTLILDIELPTKDAANYKQRERRKNFYLRNGFEETAERFSWRGVTYELLKSGDDFAPADYKNLIREFVGERKK